MKLGRQPKDDKGQEGCDCENRWIVCSSTSVAIQPVAWAGAGLIISSPDDDSANAGTAQQPSSNHSRGTTSRQEVNLCKEATNVHIYEVGILQDILLSTSVQYLDFLVCELLT